MKGDDTDPAGRADHVGRRQQTFLKIRKFAVYLYPQGLKGLRGRMDLSSSLFRICDDCCEFLGVCYGFFFRASIMPWLSAARPLPRRIP